MRVVAAYLLAVLGGNQQPAAEDVKSVLDAAGIQADDARIAAFLKEVDGKNVTDLMQEGAEKLASFGGSGGGGGGGSGGSGGDADAAPAVAEPEPEPSSSEEDLDLDLFG